MRSTTVVLRRWTTTWAVLTSIPVGFALVGSLLPSVSTASRVAVAGLLVTFAIWSYLDGPASYVAISDQQVAVANMFRRYVVPRSLVEGFEVEASGLGLELLLSGSSPIPVLAADLPLSRSNAGVGRHLHTNATRLNEALAARKPAPATGTLDRRTRPLNVLLALVPFVLVALFFIVKPA